MAGTSPGATVTLAALTLIAGVLPAGIAYVGKLIVDAVLAANGDSTAALEALGLEAVLVVALAAAQRGLSITESLLRAQLGQRVNVLILKKALTLDLTHFEDATVYDRMSRARREASSRPLALVRRVFGLLQNLVSLVGFGVLLVPFSPLTVVVLVLAAIPAFWAEAKYSGEAFRLFSWRTPETREQAWYETVLAREDYAKEVQLYGLGPFFLGRYEGIFDKLFDADRRLTIRRGLGGFLVGMVSTAAFYGAYGWIAISAVTARITLGEMTMYLLLFKQGQSALAASLSAVGGMYEDSLYLANLYAFLEMPVHVQAGGATVGPDPADGLRFEGVSFAYPGASTPAIHDVTLHIRPGAKLAIVGENGSGKTTLIKLLTRLYQPASGRILLDGLDLREWEIGTLRARIGVIFQDFVRYHISAGENIGAGDVAAIGDEGRQREAAERGQAWSFLSSFPEGLQTRLGRWFKSGRELSGGQWQKVALARAFMRKGADILVLDEPTAAMDAEAEAQIFEQFQETAQHQMAILISHRFSTVRRADQIVVLEGGRITERGTHAELLERNGRYARLFRLQAEGYR
ncbi:MAG: ABC transporter ATP-binding protein [Pseudomonadota bacterium]|nr:ABC transporter ATP-binding protein [Pseudomonadota bacterium]